LRGGYRLTLPGAKRSSTVGATLTNTRIGTTLSHMSLLQPAAVPASVPEMAEFYIGSRRFVARRNRAGQRIWIASDRRFGDVILLRSDTRRYVVAPWLEDTAPRAMRELIRSGVLKPQDPLVMLDAPTDADDANDAALRVAVIEALVESAQLTLDDALPILRAWRALRDGLQSA
jgi:hypothetical protein